MGCQWQVEGECGALAFGGVWFETEGSSVGVDDAFCDVESQAGAVAAGAGWETGVGVEEAVGFG